MRKTILLVALLTSIATAPACIVHSDGRGTMSTGSTAMEVAPEVAKGALTVAAVGLAVVLLYAKKR